MYDNPRACGIGLGGEQYGNERCRVEGWRPLLRCEQAFVNTLPVKIWNIDHTLTEPTILEKWLEEPNHLHVLAAQ